MKILVLPFVLASCFGIGWAVFVDSQQHADVDLAPSSSQVVAVEVVGLTIRDIEESLELVGSLDAGRDVEIRSRVSGQIRSLVVDVGDTIVMGQELLRIDASEQRELVRQSEAAKRVSMAEQRAQELRVSAAELEHKRQEDLRRQGVGTAQQLEASRSKLEISKAELRLSMSKVDQAESALEGSRLAVAERRIESPLSGRVAARMVQVGDLAKSDLGLLRIVDLSTVRTTLHVGERDYRSLRTGQAAEVRVDGFPEEVFVGHVERMAPVLDPQTRTAVVYVAVDNSKELLKPGMYARVRVVLERHVRASVVPLSAVVDSGDAKTMFVVSRDGLSVRQVNVQLGWTESGTMVEVLGGLSPDDRIVTLGSHLVQDGQQVEVVDAPVPTSD
ncbi:MAG: efflux RND transporter periplasmic adaptor subunit [Planctomycetaceae bacterium]